jgi:hypothetical protein
MIVTCDTKRFTRDDLIGSIIQHRHSNEYYLVSTAPLKSIENTIFAYNLNGKTLIEIDYMELYKDFEIFLPTEYMLKLEKL